MAERGRPKAPLVLTEDERQTLERWARRRMSAQALALRARIVLACAEGATNKAVAERLEIWPQTVAKWRGRFVRERLEGLSDEPRPGRPRTIADQQVEEVVVKALEEPPPDHDTHWSTRSMARQVGLSQTAISRIWRAFGLKPHLEQTWKLSTDPQFIDKVRDIVGLYLDPPERALVLCVDEKSQIQALDRTAPTLPILPTTPARRSHDYVRHGTASLFAALDVASGQVISQLHRRHRHQEFLKFLKTIDANVPAGLELHLVCDNYATHKTAAIKAWLLRHPRFHLHFTPTSASWLNLVERWFAELTNRKLRRSSHRSVAELEADLSAWIAAWNQDPKPFVWTKTADEILDSLTGYLQRTNDSGH
jgi:transposase